MQLWITSDSHFNHSNLYKFTYTDKYGVERRVRERFRDAQEGDAFMCQRWCELVKPSDHIYHIGDVTLERSSAKKQWFVNLMRSLPGHKRLILGNHDHFTIDVYRDAGFEKINGSHKIDSLLLSHYPLHPSTVPRWCHSNVHGHIHQNQSPPGRYVNVCVEQTDYAPVPIEEVAMRAKQLYLDWQHSAVDEVVGRP